MNGPHILCNGCGARIDNIKGWCEQCRVTIASVSGAIATGDPERCSFCLAGKHATNGMHYNERGGYLGRCSA